MSTDLRKVGRVVVSFEMKLNQSGQSEISCRARNISLEGMLLQAAEVGLGVGAEVVLHIDAGSRTWKVPAVVLHNYGHTIGVMFVQRQPDLYQAVTCRSAS